LGEGKIKDCFIHRSLDFIMVKEYPFSMTADAGLTLIKQTIVKLKVLKIAGACK
jgi:hypothetical protein